MDLSSRNNIKNLLEENKIKPFKGLGQNFLINQGVLKKIVEIADIKPKDIILEIGPGIGTLTQELVKKARKVIAVEKDRNLVRILNYELKITEIKNIEIIQGDILKFPISNIKFPIRKIVANLPYNIASAVIRKFLESENPPKEMILMVQKEVAKRICAKPPEMNLLAASVQFYSRPKILFYVSKNNFWPRPKVDGAIIKIVINKRRPISNKDLFFEILRAGFSHPRKQILNNLSKMLKLDKESVAYWLQKNKINSNQRAETLNIKDWLNLVSSYKK